ncbi:hypothetical protein [uncultured Desulfobulbus sp.]|uniref:hypothetical protein n=1 Tax=uncultured Desulfobulbus sp. TaxID=239745 RepID=UPI0029C806B2|nr:hypothetical protein [uncultured Desulfobulbus sp.]
MLKKLLAQILQIGERNGTKGILLVNESGIPLSIVISGAKRHGSVSLELLLKERVLGPKDNKGKTQNFCLDAGYVGKEGVVEEYGFIPHIQLGGEEKRLIEKNPTFKARRWVVEFAHSLFNRFRKLIPRYEK